MKEKIIVHADLNHCYAQIEEMKCPSLRNVAMAVGGNEKARHGIILAKNDIAKSYHIKTGESLREAYRKCPHLLVVPPNYEEYMYYTQQVKNIYQEYTSQVESFGLDEAWFDLTYSTSLFGDGIALAKTIQLRILNELGLRVSMGISDNKIFAKMGSDLDKNMGFTIINKKNYKQRIWSLPIEDLFYVGSATAKKLHQLHIFKIEDLATAPIEILQKKLGKIGEVLYQFAHGKDINNVLPSLYKQIPKSIGNSVTTPKDMTTYEEAKIVLQVLCESVASRLKEHKLQGRSIQLHIRNTNLSSSTKQCTLQHPTDISKELLQASLQLLSKHHNFDIALRSIGVCVSSLCTPNTHVQLDLFHVAYTQDKARTLDCVMDEIRNKYGFHSIKKLNVLQDTTLSSFNPKGDHVIFPQGYFR